jgi:LysR family hydrogen peroxide-inducible transcriptional activator
MLRHMVAAGEGFSLMPALAAAALGTIEGCLAYTRMPAGEGGGRNVVLAARGSDPRLEQIASVAAVLRRAVAPRLRGLARIARDGPRASRTRAGGRRG